MNEDQAPAGARWETVPLRIHECGGDRRTVPIHVGRRRVGRGWGGNQADDPGEDVDRPGGGYGDVTAS